MKRPIGVLTTIVVLVIAALSQNVTDIHRQILEAEAERKYPAALAKLQDLKTTDPKAFDVNNYDYLIGRIAESDGQLSLAMSNYQAAAARDSILTPYALMHMSQIARSTGNLMLERLYLQRIAMFYPDSLIARSVSSRMARNSFESGNYGEAIRILTSTPNAKGPTKPASNADLREDQALLAESYFRSGNSDAARQIFTELLNKVPNAAQPDDMSQTAAKGLDLMDGGADNFGKKAPDLAEGEHQRRANIYQFNRDFADAKLHFEAIISRFPTGPNAADAIFQIGRGFGQQGDYVEALKWYERVQEQYPDSVAAKDALLQTASAYSRVGKPKEATKRYQRFIEKYPADEKLDRAYLNTVDVHRDLGEDQDALKWCAKTQGVFKGKLPEALAIFAETRIYLARSEWQNALNNLERLKGFSDLGVTTPGGTSTVEITFLKGFALEQLKSYAEAIDVYLSIPDGRAEYYGWRASERLRAMSKDETASSFISLKTGVMSAGLKAKDADTRRKSAQSILRLTETPEVRERALAVLKPAIRSLPAYASVPGFKLNEKLPSDSVAAKLMFLGLYDEAMPEAEAAMTGSGKGTDDAAFTLATDYLRGDRGDRAVAFAEPLWRKIPADYPIELAPRDQLELLYPTVYTGQLLKYSTIRRVDPRLLLAIMRVESRFKPVAKSNAAARGLMQFISTTSDKVAGEVSRDNFRQDELYYPPTAILFGSQYVSDLFKVFPGQPDAVAASYNGGDDNMKRWLTRSRSNLPERYVPEIMFAQSKEYVVQVMATYRMYQYLYDENLKAH